ncbi:hypothetical protein NMY22_g14384 [Coprinellus aureogranulatus]|nr:hypothetical protein NMY22_g14384 [Coprinellus aureogranulatus]
MTGSSSPRIVAAHIHHPKNVLQRRSKENAIPHHTSSSSASGNVVRRRFKSSLAARSRIRRADRSPLAAVAANDTASSSSADYHSLADDEASVGQPSSPQHPDTTDFQDIVAHSGPALEPVVVRLFRANRIQSPTDNLERQIQELELLVAGFKSKVDVVVQGFEQLKTEMSLFALDHETLETDHFTTLSALREEQGTVRNYLGKLRNAEVEIFTLRQLVPEDKQDLAIPCSQARSLEPIYERYA